MRLKILAVSDQVSDLLYHYFQPERWRHIDLILSCGDLPPSYLDFLVTNLGVPLLYVRGNHDGTFAPDEYDGCDDVHGRIVEVRGVKIAGFAGSRRYSQGDWQYSEREMAAIVRRVQRQAQRVGSPDIVLTHAPPAGCHDGTDLPHRGFECFQDAIKLWKPKYLIHGHMHRYQGGEEVTAVGDTTVMNIFPHREFDLLVPETEPRAEIAPRLTPAQRLAQLLSGRQPRPSL